MAETRWQRIKGWFVATDPDDVAREEFRQAEQLRATPAAADRIDLTDLTDLAGAHLDDRHREHA